jgi:ABC-2 type transport system ATP-binding protein
MDAIRISKLVKKYGTVVAVDDLSLAVPKGSMFGFLGPNGSGKSTTIGCLTGLLDPTAGSIEILGQAFDTNSAALKRRMGVMPENLGLFEPLYAHEFLAFVARMFGLDEASTRQRVSELLKALELTDSSKTLSEYSTGMRKRVAFAAAVIHSPEVLFLDEPFESIDPAGVAMMKQ